MEATPPPLTSSSSMDPASTAEYENNFSFWVPSSPLHLANAEQAMLASLQRKYSRRFLRCGKYDINVLSMEAPASDAPHLLLVHGFGGGLGLWALLCDELSLHFQVHCFDLLGFARSEHPKLDTSKMSPVDAEELWVQHIEDVRVALGLNTFFLSGHSLGGFLSTCYALKYPERVRGLVLQDPVGVPQKPEDTQIPLKYRVVGSVVWSFPLLSSFRLLGPAGPGALRKARPDLQQKFSQLPSGGTSVIDYIYHCNAPTTPTGELLFTACFGVFAWAFRPLVHRLPELRVPHVTFLYGGRSWMKSDAAREVLPRMHGDVQLNILPDATHWIFMDAPAACIDAIVNIKDRALASQSAPLLVTPTLPDAAAAAGATTEQHPTRTPSLVAVACGDPEMSGAPSGLPSASAPAIVQ